MNKAETKTSIIIFNPDEGFLRVYSKSGSEMELADAEYDFEVGAQMVNNAKVPVLADGRNVSYHSKEVRDFYARKKIGEHISAMAIIVGSISTRLVANFFIRHSKPHFPTKLFTTEKAAVIWLNEFLKKETKTQSVDGDRCDSAIGHFSNIIDK